MLNQLPLKSPPHLNSCVMIDVLGTQLNKEDIERLQNPLVGGVILFSRNFSSRLQITELCQHIKSIRPQLLITVDHEGGRVQRFKSDGFTHLPPMRQLGYLWDKDPLLATQLTTQCGIVIASELLSCGIDLSFTPVLDLDYGESSVIGDRAFHSDPAAVASLTTALNHGLLLAGMKNCAKHFPGHGYVKADSHVDLPIDDRPFEDIWAQDMLPYRHMGSTVTAIMPAHVIYQQVDNKNTAGFSRYWLQTILREKLGFNGVIFSDDMSMEGARAGGDIVSGAIKAFDAGVDMVLVCNRPDLADQLLSGLIINEKSINRNAQSSKRLKKLHVKGRFSWSLLQKDSQYHAAVTDLKNNQLL